MHDIKDIIGPDGCDLNYKGSDFDPREDDESFVQRKIDRKVNKAVRGFWKEIDAESE